MRLAKVLAGAMVTPDGQTVLVIERLTNVGPPLQEREALVKCSTATGAVTATLDNNLNVLAGFNGLFQRVLPQRSERTTCTNTSGFCRDCAHCTHF